jgi:hypothetical protein
MGRAITVYLFGGLGNQMFQYASAAALAHRLQAELVLDTSWFSGRAQGTIARPFLLDQFPSLKGRIAHQDEVRWSHILTPGIGNKYLQAAKRSLHHLTKYSRWSHVEVEPSYQYWSNLKNVTAPAFLYGYWQNEQYFEDYAPQLKMDFSFSVPQNTRFDYLSYSIEQAGGASAALHVRRGDYVSGGTHLGTCTLDYYRRAVDTLIRHADQTLNVYVFSDEPDWARHLSFAHCTMHYIDVDGYRDTSVEDIALMSLCRHHVIANSSYSWWGAWLGESQDGIIAAPSRWFPRADSETTPVPLRWMRIAVD